MDTSSKATQPPGPPLPRRDGQSGEGARSVMEQLKQQERERAAQRQVEAGVPAAVPQPQAP